jgi:hypothetical protein
MQRRIILAFSEEKVPLTTGRSIPTCVGNHHALAFSRMTGAKKVYRVPFDRV